jgi:hypothetical protein
MRWFNPRRRSPDVRHPKSENWKRGFSVCTIWTAVLTIRQTVRLPSNPTTAMELHPRCVMAKASSSDLLVSHSLFFFFNVVLIFVCVFSVFLFVIGSLPHQCHSTVSRTWRVQHPTCEPYMLSSLSSVSQDLVCYGVVCFWMGRSTPWTGPKRQGLSQR